MATIAKFYLHDATSTNTGTMPSAGLRIDRSGNTATTGDATGARTARSADDVVGVANPDTESTVTSNADVLNQLWGHRRFVSAPLAAQTIAFGTPGSWTFSFACTESNLNHNQSIRCIVYAWRPTTGAQVGTDAQALALTAGTEPTVAAAEQAQSQVGTTGADATILDGDILVIDVSTNFTQAMATAYTDSFAYDGTTEASTTTCASFVTPPSALTLFAAAAASIPDIIMAPPR